MYLILLTVFTGLSVSGGTVEAKSAILPETYLNKSDCESHLWRVTSKFETLKKNGDVILIKCAKASGEIKGKSST